MANEMMKEQLAALVDSFRSDLRTLRQVQQQRAGLSASASAGGGRITVTVDADGVPADVEFTADISTLGYPEIARGVLSAAREAALEVRRQSAGLVQSVHDPQDLPKLSDFLPGVPDLSALIPGPPQDLLPPPGKPAASDDEGLVFTDVVELPPTPDPGFGIPAGTAIRRWTRSRDPSIVTTIVSRPLPPRIRRSPIVAGESGSIGSGFRRCTANRAHVCY